jgi:hypothetical protein
VTWKNRKWKKRPPIRPLGDLKEQKMENEITNKAPWLPEREEN